MATTLKNAAAQPAGTKNGMKGAAACGAAGGALAMTCCSVGILGAAAWGAGAGTVFFALGDISPVGSTPVLVAGGLLLSLGVTLMIMRWRVAGLPREVARPAIRRALGVTVFSGALTFFVLMQFVMPLLFVTGGAPMGGFFPS